MTAKFLLAFLIPCAYAQTHFHHVHLNSADPARAIEFYTQHLLAEKTTFAGADAIRTQNSWILFNKVKQPPPHEVVSSLFHIGWGAEDMKAEFERQIRLGTTFQTALTDVVELFGAGARDRSFFMYLDGPDHLTIEVQSAMNRNFMHVHMLSDDPVAAAEWYEKHFRLTRRDPALRTTRAYRGIPTGPSASLALDNVTILWYPTAYARVMYGAEWKGRTKYASPRGRVFDHVAFSVDNLDQTLERLKREGVKVLTIPVSSGGMRTAFVQAPDNVELELVEVRATSPLTPTPVKPHTKDGK
jgi:catechol 2,3-dioxygenase-like lactoylglutathione lyase family enzyme